jgi:ribosomal protein S27AE
VQDNEVIMTLQACPECGNQISDRAMMCPKCGYTKASPGFYCGEYKSQTHLFGLPLAHIVSGPAIDPATGKLRVAKGIIAIGGVAVGVVAIGGMAVGVFALGGLALGLLTALGGIAIGTGISIGGLAVGFVGIGGLAIGFYALGGGAFGAHALGGNTSVDQLPQWFKQFKR